MIDSKNEYLRYLLEDKKALGLEKLTPLDKLRMFFVPNYIYSFQRLLRRTEYYGHLQKNTFLKIYYYYLRLRLKKCSRRLGFTIPENVFGPGLAIVHYGTIIVNQGSRIGSNCRIHACTNIGASGGSKKAPQIGDNVYIAPGAKIYGDIQIANNIAIGANAVVNKSFKEEGILIAGNPAKKIKNIEISKIIKHINQD